MNKILFFLVFILGQSAFANIGPVNCSINVRQEIYAGEQSKDFESLQINYTITESNIDAELRDYPETGIEFNQSYFNGSIVEPSSILLDRTPTATGDLTGTVRMLISDLKLSFTFNEDMFEMTGIAYKGVTAIGELQNRATLHYEDPNNFGKITKVLVNCMKAIAE